MPGSSAPERGNSGLASSGVSCRKPWRRRRQIPKPTPLSARRKGDELRSGRRGTSTYVLVCTGHDDDRSRWSVWSGHGKSMQISGGGVFNSTESGILLQMTKWGTTVREVVTVASYLVMAPSVVIDAHCLRHSLCPGPSHSWYVCVPRNRGPLESPPTLQLQIKEKS